MNIPTVIETYEEGSLQPSCKISDEVIKHTTVDGDEIIVQYWCRWPNYDMIFGTPAPDSPKYKKEFGYFAFRSLRDGKEYQGWHLYTDQAELREMVEGFCKVLKYSTENRPEEWAAHSRGQEKSDA